MHVSSITKDAHELIDFSKLFSKYDYINLLNAQIEMFKLLSSGEKFSSSDEFATKYNSVMLLKTDQFVDESYIYMKDNYDSPICVEAILCGCDVLHDCMYAIRTSANNSVVYISNGNQSNQLVKLTAHKVVKASQRKMVLGILDCLYNGYRVITVDTDKASVFRENRFLTQLYVKLLCNAN